MTRMLNWELDMAPKCLLYTGEYEKDGVTC